MTLLGIHLISPLAGDWHGQQLPLIQRGRFNVAKVLISGSAATAPENVEQLLDVLVPGPNGRKTIILRTDDTLRPWSNQQKTWSEELHFEYVERGFQALVAKRSDTDFYLEIGNEENLAGQATDQTIAMLKQAVTLKPAFGSRLSWIASLPTALDGATACIERGATDGYEALGCHLYGDYQLGDGGYDWPKILDLCLQQDRAVWVTEAGINDPKTPKATKASRILDWMSAHATPRLVGLCVFVEGFGTQWPQYEIDNSMADVFAKRSTASPPPVVTPPAKPPVTPTPPITQPTPPDPPAGIPQGAGTMNYGGITNLVDLRKQLKTNPNGGPNQRVSLASKTGIVVHYNGPPVHQSALAQLKGDAVYHCQEIWGYSGNGAPLYGDGIMYHIGIGEDGTAYLMRDFEQVLWHCAAWPQNASALSVTIPIGDGQHATKAALATLKRICDEWRGTGHGSKVWGHQELSPTSCPGTLMDDFIYPYRAGNLTYEEIKPMATYVKFDETGHGVGGGFLSYFQKYGGVRIFGFPLTEEVTATGEDGKPVRAQYFERARFEWRSGQAPADYDVTLSRLGANQLAADEAKGVVK